MLRANSYVGLTPELNIQLINLSPMGSGSLEYALVVKNTKTHATPEARRYLSRESPDRLSVVRPRNLIYLRIARV